jgi:NDP-sugar pyrophosphorylase family protein
MTRTIAILAGGLGTRMASVTGGVVPKAMLPVAGRPFIEHKLLEAKRLGATRVVLLLGHGADQVASRLGDGSRYGLEIVTAVDGPRLLGTGGALRRAAPTLGDRAWVTYGDTLLDVDLDRAEATAGALGCPAVMTVLLNDDRWQPGNTSVANGKVVAYEKGAPLGSHRYIDYGYTLLPAAALNDVDEEAFDLDVIFRLLIRAGKLAAFVVTERFHDIGTPEALAETEAWLASMPEPAS